MTGVADSFTRGSAQARVTSVGAGVVVVSGQAKVTSRGQQFQIQVTAGNQPLPITIGNVSGTVPVSAAGGSFAVSAQGGSFAVNLVNVSGQVKVTAGDASLNINVANVSGQVKVTAGDVPVVVTVASQPVAVSQNAPLAWEVGARGDAVFNATVSNPVKFARFQAAGAVCADVVAGVAGRKIRVLGGFMVSTGTATAIWMTTGASAALTGKIPIANGLVWTPNEFGYFETAAGSALSLQIEGGTIGGGITYAEVF